MLDTPASWTKTAEQGFCFWSRPRRDTGAGWPFRLCLQAVQEPTGAAFLCFRILTLLKFEKRAGGVKRREASNCALKVSGVQGSWTQGYWQECKQCQRGSGTKKDAKVSSFGDWQYRYKRDRKRIRTLCLFLTCYFEMLHTFHICYLKEIS